MRPMEYHLPVVGANRLGFELAFAPVDVPPQRAYELVVAEGLFRLSLSLVSLGAPC